MIIFLDTAGFESVRFAAVGSGKRSGKFHEKTFAIGRQNSHRTLTLLDAFLKSAKVARAEISALYVVTGAGSFNGIRTGVALGLALGYAWCIPLYAIDAVDVPQNLHDLATSKLKKKKVSDAAAVIAYGREPNITPTKKKF